MQLLTTTEVADYLRLKERKIYDLVQQGEIPFARLTGKLVFPKEAIDLWIMQHLEGDQYSHPPAPPIYAGSSDPLLDWALREANTGLAQLCHGSADGVQRLLEGQAQLCGIHIIDPTTNQFNQPSHCGLGGLRDLVIIRWAKRQQGLIVARGNPLGITGLQAISDQSLRVVQRQQGAGAQTLLDHLLSQQNLPALTLEKSDPIALDEDAVAIEVASNRADCGLAIKAAAQRHDLNFIPLIEEPLDLAMRRRTFFEPSIQRLFALTTDSAQQAVLHQQAQQMGGYDLSECGQVIYNA